MTTAFGADFPGGAATITFAREGTGTMRARVTTRLGMGVAVGRGVGRCSIRAMVKCSTVSRVCETDGVSG
ncbi:MAG: hypothetical protein M3R51_08510 [Candidatus Eremiobacteraeota bacterium]|nr:hypothetical protein [Candidatus Eremiobacteraeota bacterium]